MDIVYWITNYPLLFLGVWVVYKFRLLETFNSEDGEIFGEYPSASEAKIKIFKKLKDEGFEEVQFENWEDEGGKYWVITAVKKAVIGTIEFLFIPIKK